MKGIKAELTWVPIKWPLHLLRLPKLNKPYFGLLKEADVDQNIEDSNYGYEGNAKFR